MLGVSFDTIEENENFAKRHDFPFRLLSDRDHTIGLAYGACDADDDEYARRIAYLIDEEGKIAQAHAKVDPKTYPRKQLESI